MVGGSRKRGVWLWTTDRAEKGLPDRLEGNWESQWGVGEESQD